MTFEFGAIGTVPDICAASRLLASSGNKVAVATIRHLFAIMSSFPSRPAGACFVLVEIPLAVRPVKGIESEMELTR